MIKMSISNIAWLPENDEEMYSFMNHLEYSGLEIAPTRIFPEKPYNKIIEAKKFKKNLKEKYNLEISSMQSILYGINEKIFSTPDERLKILNYIKSSILFADAIGSKNLVFGSPKNRITNNEKNYEVGIEFFKTLGEYAVSNNTILSIEPNPVIYGTNYINTTQEAIELVKNVNSQGFKVNFDFGTFLYNKELLSIVKDNIELINHIHISEPYLKNIEKRSEHRELIDFLKVTSFKNYISIEMSKCDDIEIVKRTMIYLKEILND